MIRDRPENENPNHTKRRRFLQGLGALGVVGLAGCGGDGDTPTDTDSDATATGTDTDGDATATAGEEETPTATETEPTGGEETPTETDAPTDTETETPAQNIPDDPPTLVTLDGGRSVEPGGTTTVTATVENPYLYPIQSVQISLEPSNTDWTVEATGDTNLGTIDTAASAAVSWEITAPDEASGDITLTGTFSYETTTDGDEVSLSRSVKVFTPGDAPQEGLEAYFPLDGDAPTNLVTGTDATILGDPTPGAAGIVGDAFSFDASNDDGLSSEPLPINGTEATIAAWYRFSSHERFARVYEAGTGSQDGAWEVLFDETTNDLSFLPEGGDFSSPITLSPDTWYFVVTVLESSSDYRLTVYDESGQVDSVSASDGNRTGDANKPLNMMAKVDGDEESTGRMDEVRVYSRALLEEEVDALYSGSF
jgi:hypothetical protein